MLGEVHREATAVVARGVPMGLDCRDRIGTIIDGVLAGEGPGGPERSLVVGAHGNVEILRNGADDRAVLASRTKAVKDLREGLDLATPPVVLLADSHLPNASDTIGGRERHPSARIPEFAVVSCGTSASRSAMMAS